MVSIKSIKILKLPITKLLNTVNFYKVPNISLIKYTFWLQNQLCKGEIIEMMSVAV